MNEKIEELVDKFGLKNAIRLVIGGWILDGGDVQKISTILQDMVYEYNKEINDNT